MWGRKSKIKLAKTASYKAGAYAYRDRRAKKRSMRGLWLIRMNAALRLHGAKYSTFINDLKKTGVLLDRKILADLAAHYPAVFQKIVESVRG